MAERGFRWLAAFALAVCAHASLAADARRVVALGGDITETVYALDAQHELVGVDSTSQWPAAVRALPDVGYVRQLAAEGVLALRPTLILATHDAGPPTVIAQLREAGVRIELMPVTRTPEGVIAKVRAVGRALGREEAAEALAGRLAAQYASLAADVARMPWHPRVLFLMATEGSPMAAGRDTAAASAIALAGGTHAGDGFAGYKPVSPEAMAALAPDVILLMREREQAVGGVDGVLRLPGVALTPAGRQRRIVFVDGQALLGFGPRNAGHEQDLQRLLADLRP
jgi:iron complex transport system substrate-binding protein